MFLCLQKGNKNREHISIVFFKHKYITLPTRAKADVVINATGDLAKTIEVSLPSNTPPTNYVELWKVLAIFDNIAKMNVLEEKWEESAFARVLRHGNNESNQRVTKTGVTRTSSLRAEEDECDKLIVELYEERDIGMSSAPAFYTRARTEPMAITQESICSVIDRESGALME